MAILIKGMDEIPEDGAVLVVRHDNGKAYIKHARTYGYSMELVKQPAVQPEPCEDAISRRAAIDAVSEACEECRGTFARCEEKLLALPPVQPDHVADIGKKVEGDCISRQATVDALKETLNPSITKFVQSKLAIENLPSAQSEQRWIPSSEKPPKEGSYLVWMPFAPPEDRIAVAKCCDGYWNIKTPISAWMPLPEPYGGGEKE